MLNEVQKDEPIYPIRMAAKLLNISVHTLRMYEKENLILPFKKSTVIASIQNPISTELTVLDQLLMIRKLA